MSPAMPFTTARPDCAVGCCNAPTGSAAIAEMLGVRRTTVTLLAQELQKRGILRYSRGRITILDRATLESCACECYGAAKQDTLAQRIGIKL